MTFKLRPYQQAAVDSLYQYWGKSKGNPLVVVPTAGGKSAIQGGFIKSVYDYFPDHHQRIMCVTHVKELISQNEEKIKAFWPQAPVGVYSAGLKRRETMFPITVAGIQSVYKKAHEFGFIHLLIVDEVHLLGPDDDTMYRRFIADLRSYNPNLKILGMTATPFRMKGGMLTHGDNAMFDDIAYEITIDYLLGKNTEGPDGQGVQYISHLKSKSSKVQADLTGVRTQGGDYNQKQAAEAIDQDELTTAVLNEVFELAADRKSWLVFCQSVKHAEHVRDAIRARGVTCEMVTGETDELERERIIAGLRSGGVKAVTNYGVLCLDDQTEILTRQGWVGIDEMTYEHQVANWDQGSMFFKEPKFIVRRDRLPDEKMITLETLRRSVRVTSNHRMLFRAGRKGEFKIVPAIDLVGKKGEIPICGIMEPELLKAEQEVLTDKKKALAIRANSYHYRKAGMSPDEAKAQAIQRLEDRYSMDYKNPNELSLDECRFIGFWIGDGAKSKGKICISQASIYPKIIEWVDLIIKSCQISHTRRDCSHYKNPHVRWEIATGRGFGPQKKEGVYSLLPYLEKDGSDLLWGLNKGQFEALIEGFWLADGEHGLFDEGMPEVKRISNINIKLLNLLQSIAVCRGFSASVSLGGRKRKENHEVLHRLNIAEWQSHSMTKHRFSIEEEPFKKERVWCVTSHTGNIVTRRNGKVTIMGNTTGFDCPGLDCIVLLRATQSLALYIQMLGRAMRLHGRTIEESIANGKSDALILDYAGNLERFGPINMISVKNPKPKDSKFCPTCREINVSTARVCVSCAYEFYEEAKKHCPECRASLPPATRVCNAEIYACKPCYDREMSASDDIYDLLESALKSGMMQSFLPSKFKPDSDRCSWCAGELISFESFSLCPNESGKYVCGYEYPESEVDHFVTASDGLVIADARPVIETVEVDWVKYELHEKKVKADEAPKPPSLKVTYFSGMNGRYPEWVLLEHDGFARKKAEAWWNERIRKDISFPIPTTINEALTLTAYLKEPQKIAIRKNGKFWDIVSVQGWNVANSGLPPANLPKVSHDQHELLEEEIPF